MNKTIDMYKFKYARLLAQFEAIGNASLAEIQQGLPRQMPEQRHHERASELLQDPPKLKRF